jgi:pheromone shutdown protein TraB
MEQTNQTIEATWGIATKIWWWIIWRSVLSAMGGGFVLGFIIGIIDEMAGLDSATIQLPAMLFGGIFGAIVNIFFTKKIIGKKFKDYSLVLLKTE